MSVGGSWLISQAVSERWTEAGLDAKFRAEWQTPSDADHQPLNDEEARPNTPMPFCVVTVEKPVRVSSSTGKSDATKLCEQLRIGVMFQIEARRKQNTGESSKSVAKRMLELVLTAFDPAAGLWPVPAGAAYRLMRVQRASDWLSRNDQNTHEGGVRYEVFVDAEVGRRPD